MDFKEKDKQRKSLGRIGEDMAAAFLEKKGYTVLDRNFHGGHKEIDIVCRDGDDLRFVEVKTRREPMEGQPWEAVDSVKQHRIGNAANAYLASDERPKFRVDEIHFDVIAIVWDENGENASLEYIPDAFMLIFT